MGAITAQIEGIEWIVILIILASALAFAEEFLRRRKKRGQESVAPPRPAQPSYPMPPSPP